MNDESDLKVKIFPSGNVLMVVNVWNIGKIVIMILQGSVVTQTVLGGLTMHLPVANFL